MSSKKASIDRKKAEAQAGLDKKKAELEAKKAEAEAAKVGQLTRQNSSYLGIIVHPVNRYNCKPIGDSPERP